jgi:hypothetical protein
MSGEACRPPAQLPFYSRSLLMSASLAHYQVRVAAIAMLCVATLSPASMPVACARPSSMKLLPEETLAFIRVANARELVDRMRETTTGRMLRDPQLRPFLEHLWGKAEDFYAEKAQGVLGISLEQLQKLPQGEIAVGLVPCRVKFLAPLVLIDLGDQADVAQKTIAGALEKAREEGSEISTETIGGVEFMTLAEKGGGDELHFFWKENTLVASTRPELLREVLRHWEPSAAGEVTSEAATPDGEEVFHLGGRTLAENNQFTTILRHCRREQDPPPQLIFYADPIGFVHAAAAENAGLRVFEAMLPALGLDGVLGVGGTSTYATGRYEDLSHLHLLLGNPRAGVVQLLAFEPGDMAPQPWVPLAVETYMTCHWNFRAFYDRLAAIIDGFQHPGATDEFVAKRFSENLGVDVLADVIGNLAGRATYIVGYEKPATMRSQKQVLVLELTDEAAAVKTLDTIRARYADLFKERTFGKVTYYALVPKWLEAMPEDQRPFSPMLAIMDGNLFVGGSTQLFERCVAARDGTIDRLADSEDYTRLATALGKETSGATPVGLLVSRPQETFRHLYELLTSDRTRQYLEEHSENNPVWAALSEALAEHELPPFDVLAHYLAPTGAILYDTDSGFHSIGFTLREEVKQ